jgi:hypothetical protein
MPVLLCMTGCKLMQLSQARLNGPQPGAAAPADNLPPAAMLMQPGPGVDGPGPGVLIPEPNMTAVGPASQVAFVGPTGMHVFWDASGPGLFDSEPLVTPGRYNFPQGAIYRLKLTNVPGRPGVELYPTIEIGPSMPRTEAYLAHNSIPVQFTEEDFDQVLSGNFVTKVVYLPDPEFQELAIAGVETLFSTRLALGEDPIVEADRRGAIMAIIRLGNKDLAIGGGAGGAVGPNGEILPQSYNAAMGAAGAMGMGGYCGPNGYPPANVAGVTTAEYGMPMSGTPIGLPGPPHIPFGNPAGLCYYGIHNHTHNRIPYPVNHFNVHVKQQPGMSYPPPVSTVHINETAIAAPANPCGPGYCPPQQ